jgi:hypothetical protein
LFLASQDMLAAPTNPQVTNQAMTATSLSYSGTFYANQPLTFTAYVSPMSPGSGRPSGSVTFKDGNSTLGTGPVSLPSTGSNVVTLSLPTGLAAGPHSITAVYSGDSNFLISTSSPPLNKTVSLVSTTTTLTTSVNPVVTGNPVTLTATVVPATISSTNNPAIPTTESVSFYDLGSSTSTTSTGTLLGSAPINSAGVAQLPATFTTAGSHLLKAVYSGDSTFSTSTGTLTQSVSSTPTTAHVYVSASANPALVGQSITFTALVYGSTSAQSGATGTVKLMDGTSTLGMGTLTGGKATFTIANLSAGSHAITASYSGDANFTMATSSVLSEYVGPTGTISGIGTLMSNQYSLALNVHSSVVSGAPSYSGTLSFSNSAAADTFTAATINSVQIGSSGTPAPGGTPGVYSYFRITGTATLNGGSSPAYSFVIAVALPVAGATTSTASGYLSITVSGPSGFTPYSKQLTTWDPGENITIMT